MGRKGRSKAGAFTAGRGWRKTIGARLTEGRLIPCRFWLGFDEQRAIVAALQIEAIWIGLGGASHWDHDALALAENIRVGLTRHNAPVATASPLTATIATVAPKPPLTVKGGIERYRSAMLADARLSDATKHSIRCRTASLERSPIAPLPLAEIGAEQLTATVAHWLARPIAPKTGTPVSTTSATIIIKTARATFDYLDGVGLWDAPKRFERIFRLPRSAAPKVQTLDLDELRALYAVADSRNRLLILLGLNCGFCTMEIATLKRSEIDLEAKTIRRARQKTAVEQQWVLWAETAELLAKHLAPINDRGLALLTDGGKPLVYYSPKSGGRIDTVVHCWARLAKRAKVAKPFKLVRKTGATLVRSIGGIEVSEAYLAHAERSMARFYSRPEPQRLTDALTELRARLNPMFPLQRGVGGLASE